MNIFPTAFFRILISNRNLVKYSSIFSSIFRDQMPMRNSAWKFVIFVCFDKYSPERFCFFNLGKPCWKFSISNTAAFSLALSVARYRLTPHLKLAASCYILNYYWYYYYYSKERKKIDIASGRKGKNVITFSAIGGRFENSRNFAKVEWRV